MKHLFQNDDGEMVAADSLEQAARYHDCELGGAAEPEDGWSQIPDGRAVSIREEDGVTVVTKTAAQWASEFGEPMVAATTYT